MIYTERVVSWEKPIHLSTYVHLSGKQLYQISKIGFFPPCILCLTISDQAHDISGTSREMLLLNFHPITCM